MKCQAAIFDLDGVIVDTAKFHYQAWKETAKELGLDFTLEQNELLKGVSRMASLDILLNLAGVTASQKEKERMADEKNQRYVLLTQTVTPADALPGIVDCITQLKRRGVKIVLGSASKNARPVLDRLGLTGQFDTIVDGTQVSNPKPDPEVFLKGAELTGVPTDRCVVFEDSVAGIQAAKTGGMFAVGVGDPSILALADIVVQRTDCEAVYQLF